MTKKHATASSKKTAKPTEGQKDCNWKHPGGKLLKLGPDKLTEDELLAILIGTGGSGRTALDIAKDILDKYCSIYGLMGKPGGELLKIKGLKKRKLVRLIAAYELARRLVEHDNNWDDFKPLKTPTEDPNQPNLFK